MRVRNCFDLQGAVGQNACKEFEAIEDKLALQKAAAQLQKV